jgi:hypothetical protein
MGPNLYITPPGSYTIFHQDGHGTVDSGHLCLSGYNEVIILRRLTETHKKNAMKILNGNDYPVDDALYHLPHAERTVSRCLISASNKHLFAFAKHAAFYKRNIYSYLFRFSKFVSCK